MQSAPWMKIAESMDYVMAVVPRRAFPTHEMVLSRAGKNLSNARLEWATQHYRHLLMMRGHIRRTMGELMATDVYKAHVDDDQEQVARLIAEADLLALPVVDSENRLVGIVTVDDAMRVLEEEQTEDVARAGGAEPLEHPYLATSMMGLARSRVIWLMVLLIAATLTVNVLNVFEATLLQEAVLVLFIPLVIGAGGNAGSQAATTVTRALAVGELRPGDVALVVLREARVGLLLGAMLAAIALLPTWLFVGQHVALVVALTLLAVATLATTIGSLLPLLARRLGFDPAVMSAPFISTLVDASGLVVYFMIAKAVLGI